MKSVLIDMYTCSSLSKVNLQLTADIILDIDYATTLPIESAIPVELESALTVLEINNGSFY